MKKNLGLCLVIVFITTLFSACFEKKKDEGVKQKVIHTKLYEGADDPVPFIEGNILIATEDWIGPKGFVYRVNEDNGLSYELLHTTTGRVNLSISPDGTKYIINNGRLCEVWSTDGERMGSYDANANHGDFYLWSSDSRYFYSGVYFKGIIEIDTESNKYLDLVFSNYETYDHSPAISPDGKYLVWGHHEWGNNLDICVAETTKLPVYKSDSRIVWSGSPTSHDAHPLCVFVDNENFVFIFNEYDHSEVHLVNVNTGEIREILRLPDYISSFRLSHNKKYIAMVSWDKKLYLINTINWEALIIDGYVSGYDTSIAWSPDDEYFAVISNGERIEYGDHEYLYFDVVNVDLYSVGKEKKWLQIMSFDISEREDVGAADWGL